MIEDQVLKCHHCGKLISKHNRLSTEVYIFHKECLGYWYDENFLMDD